MPSYEIELVTLAAQPTLTMRFKAQQAELGAKFGEALPATFQHAMSQNCQITGQPFGRFHHLDEATGTWDVEAGVPIAQPAAGRDDIASSELPAGPTATTVHVGPYESLGEAHRALEQWVRDNAKRPRGGAWEVYLTDPGSEPDSQKWQTKLFLPVE